MGYSLTEIEGMSEEIEQLLYKFGVTTTYDLLTQGNTFQKRLEIARYCNLPVTVVNRFVSLADLLRVRGIMTEYAELLEEAGIKNVSQLQQADPDRLSQKLIALNGRKKLTTHTPTQDIMRTLVERSQELPILLKE